MTYSQLHHWLIRNATFFQQPVSNADFVIPVEIEGTVHQVGTVHVWKDNFLSSLSKFSSPAHMCCDLATTRVLLCWWYWAAGGYFHILMEWDNITSQKPVAINLNLIADMLAVSLLQALCNFIPFYWSSAVVNELCYAKPWVCFK